MRLISDGFDGVARRQAGVHSNLTGQGKPSHTVQVAERGETPNGRHQTAWEILFRVLGILKELIIWE